MLTAAAATTIVNSPPLPIGWSGLLLFPCAYFTLRGSFTGSAGQRHRQGGNYGSAGSRRACVERSVVHFQMRPVENGGRLSLETRKPITPIVGSSRKQSAASAICASALNARCGGGTALQTKPVTRQAPTITKNSRQHKLDDSGKPPHNNDNNGGGGNGKGSPNNGGSGGLLLFGFLLFMNYLKDLENKGGYREKRERDHGDERI